MAIEFRCPQCQKLLRVSDDSAGAKAKCPSCSAVVDVPASEQSAADGDDLSHVPPASATNPFGGDPSFQSKPLANESENPYGSPAGVYQPVSIKPSHATEIVPTPADPGQIISYAWEVWKNNLGLLVGITAVVFGINIGFAVIQGGIEFGFAQQGEQPMGQLVGGFVSIFSNLIQLFLAIGQTQINLTLLRGERADFNQLFGGGSLYFRMLGATILFALMLIAGMLACIIPAIIISILFWPYFYLIADEKAGAIESLGMAIPLGQSNVGTSLLIWLLSSGIMIVGLLAVCVGMLFAAPLVSLLWGTTYLMMSGQLQQQPKY